jgi:glycoprotein 6-alpha-L-fucosyltransferase
MAYELMQARFPDASWRFKSLDDVFYFGGQSGHPLVALYDHDASGSGEISMRVGDRLNLAGNHWNGYSMVKNERSGLQGLVPSYKLTDIIETY